MKILVDTNVVLDLLLDREPFATAAAGLFSRIQTGAATGFLCATTVTTTHYLIGKALGAKRATGEIRKLTDLFQIAAVDQVVLEAALFSGFVDFEDGVLHAAAKRAGVQGIVTRNQQGFRVSELPVYSPDEVLRLLRAGG